MDKHLPWPGQNEVGFIFSGSLTPHHCPVRKGAARTSQTRRVRSDCARQHSLVSNPGLLPGVQLISTRLFPLYHLLITLFSMMQEYGDKGKREKKRSLHWNDMRDSPELTHGYAFEGWSEQGGMRPQAPPPWGNRRDRPIRGLWPSHASTLRRAHEANLSHLLAQVYFAHAWELLLEPSSWLPGPGLWSSTRRPLRVPQLSLG